MQRKLLWTCLFGTVVVITGCGGGGGGGGGGGTYNSPNPYLRTEVPYATPVRVATIDPLVNVSSATGHKWAVTDTYAEDLNSTGNQDIIIGGRMSQSTTISEWGSNQISILSWNGSSYVDKTSQWFTGNENVILGTEPNIEFADFFKTGRKNCSFVIFYYLFPY
jgi:hypothetical protein